MRVQKRTKSEQKCFQVSYLHSTPVFHHYINETKLWFDRECEENKFILFYGDNEDIPTLKGIFNTIIFFSYYISIYKDYLPLPDENNFRTKHYASIST